MVLATKGITMRKKRTGKCYLVIQEGKYDHQLKIVKATTKRPALTSTQLMVAVELSIPVKAFDNLLPVVEINIPEGKLIAPEVKLKIVDD